MGRQQGRIGVARWHGFLSRAAGYASIGPVASEVSIAGRVIAARPHRPSRTDDPVRWETASDQHRVGRVAVEIFGGNRQAHEPSLWRSLPLIGNIRIADLARLRPR